MIDKIQDSYLGSIIGGAVGDALGYAVEFISRRQIVAKYGPCGITSYNLTDGVALISDDTQMTLFTADGLLRSGGKNIVKSIHASYLDWLKTQYSYTPKKKHGLASVQQLYSPRAPGNTCLSALDSGFCGSIANPINRSKGCGGIMRAAPVALYAYKNGISIDKADILAAESAAITHGHELGFIPAAMLSHIIYEILDGKNIEDAVSSAIDSISVLFPESSYLDMLSTLIARAVSLAKGGVSDIDAIDTLGEGWVAEETLAVAVFSAIRYQNDFEKAITVSVNHNGDSDSTGSVCGNILGAYLGLSQIPQKYLENLELSSLITDVANSLYKNEICY